MYEERKGSRRKKLKDSNNIRATRQKKMYTGVMNDDQKQI